MVFIGFIDGSKVVQYYDAKNRSIKVPRNITFNEDEEPRALDIIEVPSIQVEGDIISPATQQPAPVPKTPQPGTPEPRQIQKTGFIDYSKLSDPRTHRSSTQKTPQEPLTPDRPTESLRAKQREKLNLAEELFLDTSFLTKGAKEDLPQSYDKVIKGPEADQWKEAMEAEMSQLNKMRTWKKEDLPEEWKAIGCRWVFARKKDKHKRIVKYNACPVT